jgi:mono/diheme cytochrome c family protein
MKRMLIFFVMAIGLMSQTKKPAAPAQVTFVLATGKDSFGTLQVPQASIARGKQVYLQQCLACHQADAGGVEGMNPSLIKAKFVLGDKAALVKIVLNGLTGVEIDGDKYNGVMAPHADLTDLEIADVLTYIRNNFGNKASAITPAQVKAIRAANKPGNSAANKPTSNPKT